MNEKAGVEQIDFRRIYIFFDPHKVLFNEINDAMSKRKK
jgi:hypothetical protein